MTKKLPLLSPRELIDLGDRLSLEAQTAALRGDKERAAQLYDRAAEAWYAAEKVA